MGDIQFNGTPEEWDALVKKNKKKETLEEVEIISKQRIHKYRPMKPHPASFFIGFRAGAEWQQERMYSEEPKPTIKQVDYVAKKQERMYSAEEVLEIVSNCDGSISQAKKWFEQNKKK